MPTTSKQHFEQTAGILRDYRTNAPADLRDKAEVITLGLAKRFADAYADDNPRFDRAHFIAACMGDEAGVKAAKRARRIGATAADAARAWNVEPGAGDDDLPALGSTISDLNR